MPHNTTLLADTATAAISAVKAAATTTTTNFPTSAILPTTTTTNFPTLAILLSCVAFLSLYCFVASITFNNYSLIDRLWSILPPAYAIYIVYDLDSFLMKYHLHIFHYPKVVIMALLVIIWGTRLTYNFARKGGYSLHNEDYRWLYVREAWLNNNVVLFQLLNLTFISTIQSILLYLLVHPLYLVAHNIKQGHQHTLSSGLLPELGNLTQVDGLIIVLFLIFFALEITADEQQWRFYTGRALYKAQRFTNNNKPPGAHHTVAEYRQGFNQSGLFQYSRHPNFLSEISMWVLYSLFAVDLVKHAFFHHGLQYSVAEARTIARQSAFASLCGALKSFLCSNTSRLFQYAAQCDVLSILQHPFSTFFGCFILWSIFMGSTPLTETLSCKKYPAYKDYQQRVGRLIPSLSAFTRKTTTTTETN